MQAIETEYKGIRFRSRLEARWAIFFDAMEMPWRYESEAYKIGWESDPKFYLPDFYLPKTETWVEVKGVVETIDWEKTLAALDWNKGLPKTARSMGTSRGLLLLGDVPFVKDQYPCHPLLQHHEGVLGYLGVFTAAGDIVPVGVRGPSQSQELQDLLEKQYDVRPSSLDHFAYADALTGAGDEMTSFVVKSIDGTRSLDQLSTLSNYKVSTRVAKAYAVARGHRFYEGKADLRNVPPVRARGRHQDVDDGKGYLDCLVCGGTCVSTKGGPCVPCAGSGKKPSLRSLV